MVGRRAFTLVELLVVVAIIAALVAILIPALGGAKDNAKKVLCATNLKSQGNAFASYAVANNDTLPNMNGGYWLHDQASDIVAALIGAAQSTNLNSLPETSIRKWFFCPTNSDANNDLNWTHFTDPSGNGYHCLDYVYFNKRGVMLALGPPTGGGLTRWSNKQPNIMYGAHMMMATNASTAELACDEIISSTTGGSDFDGRNSASVCQEHSSHLKGRFPQGMNVLTYDGGVTWRNFPRTITANSGPVTPIQQTTGRGGGLPTATAWFWIVDP
jgi:prepilin-type N-terminal cleavage/methylation domain-containing protein